MCSKKKFSVQTQVITGSKGSRSPKAQEGIGNLGNSHQTSWPDFLLLPFPCLLLACVETRTDFNSLGSFDMGKRRTNLHKTIWWRILLHQFESNTFPWVKQLSAKISWVVYGLGDSRYQKFPYKRIIYSLISWTDTKSRSSKNPEPDQF